MRARAIPVAVGFLLTLCVPCASLATQYPPGPGSVCPDSLVILNIQNPAASCHPALGDSVYGVGGICTALDTKPSGVGFYMQMSNGYAYSGIDVFTANTNWPFVRGDSVVVEGAQYTKYVGDPELTSLSGSWGDMVIRKVSSGNPLPPFHDGSVHEFNASLSNTGADKWAGALVRVTGTTMRVARTVGVGSNWYVVDNIICPPGSGGPCDSMFVDGTTLPNPNYGQPPLGTLVQLVQGVYGLSTTYGPRIRIRDSNDVTAATPPNLSDAYSVHNDTIRVVFDRTVTQASAENTGNYSLFSGGMVHTATLESNGFCVNLAISNGLSPGADESVTVSNVVSAQSLLPMAGSQTRFFANGVMPITVLQTPNPDSLFGFPCVDRSRFSGLGSAAGIRVSLRGTCVGILPGSLWYLEQASATPRSGVTCYGSLAPPVQGHQYLIVGQVQEYWTETEVVNPVHARDEGPATVPDPVIQSVAVLRDTTCDDTQTLETGEEYEGMLVKLRSVKVLDEPGPGQSFRVLGPSPAFTDTILILNSNGQAWTFDASQGAVLDITGIVRLINRQFVVAPRSNADFLVDESYPTTVLISGPAEGAWVDSTSATFTWTGSDDVTPVQELRYSFRTDGGSWSSLATTTSTTLSGLSEGAHTFEVYAVDLAGKADPTPEVRHFTVDVTPPSTSFIAPTPAEGSSTSATTVVLSWAGSDNLTLPAQLRYDVQIDDSPWSDFGAVTTDSLSRLAAGTHAFRVRATDLAGLTESPPAIRTFTYVIPPPVPAATVSNDTLTFSWQRVPGLADQFRLDLSTAASSDSIFTSIPVGNELSYTYTGAVADGRTYYARVAPGIAGDTTSFGFSAFSSGVRVDQTPPSTAFTTGPADSGWIGATSTTFGWSGTDDVTAPGALRYARQLDGGAWSALGSDTSATFSGLTEGMHTVAVYALDEAGNSDVTPAQRTFTVDVTLPETQITSGPAEGDTLSVADTSFSFTGTDNLASTGQLVFAYSLDGGAYSAYSSATSVSLTGLFNSTYIFAVRARDLAGNVDATPATRTFVVRVMDLVVSGPVTLPTDTLFDNVTVQNGGTLTVGGLLTVTQNMTVASGGVVTHAARDTAGLRLNVSGMLTVASGGAIDVSGKGLLGGNNGSAFGYKGETFGTGDAIVAGAQGTWGAVGAGAGYGGLGATSTGGKVGNPVYGLAEEGRHLGSGGGGGYRGGNGGGRIWITAPALVVNGEVLADGQSGAYLSGQGAGGGGSGGGIRLEVGTLSGTGTIRARGGGGTYSIYPHASGSGGGGRITITYDALTLPVGNVQAPGSGVNLAGAAGTIYLRDRAQPLGELIVDNAGAASAVTTPLRTGLSTVRRAAIQQRAWLTVAADVPVPEVDTLQVSGSGSTLTVDVDLAFPAGRRLEVLGGGTLNVASDRTLALGAFDETNIQSGTVSLAVGARLAVATDSVTVGSGVTLVKSGVLGASGDGVEALTVRNGGVVTHAQRDTVGLRLNVSGTLIVEAGGKIDVSGRGLLGGLNGSAFGYTGETFDANDAIVAGAQGAWGVGGAGAGYGGLGATSTNNRVSNPVYGLAEEVRHLGSGGGGYYGGNGGGRIWIMAPVLVVEGEVLADGQNGLGVPGSGAGGGGSGGGIRLEVGTLSGAGTIRARGGAGQGFSAYTGGSGGGGRITIRYDALTLSAGNVQAPGSGANLAGAAGTIYLKDNAQAQGDVIVDNGGVASAVTTPLRTGLTWIEEVSVRNAACLTLDSTQRVIDWTTTVTLESSTVSATDSIRLEGTTLRGSGTVAVKLVNQSGTVSPGTSAGQLVCASGYEQRDAGTLRIEVGGASVGQYDHLHVVGNATLGGTLSYDYVGGYTPPADQRFPFLSYGMRSGQFGVLSSSDTSTAVSYLDTTTVLVAGDLGSDHMPPNTLFTAGLADSGWTKADTASFAWSGTDNASPPSALRYSYRLDSGSWSALGFGTTASFVGLAAGQHTVQVYAVDEMGNADATPAQRSFAVDQVAPTVAYVAGPANGDTVGTAGVSFTVRGADDRAPLALLTYSRSLDGAAYTSPAPDTVLTLSGLADGSHTLNVRAHDPAGNMGTPVARTWRVEASAPEITVLAGPAEGAHIGVTDTSFTWTATSVSTLPESLLYRYALDAAPSGAWGRDTSASFSGLTATTHTLNLEAQDRWGHVGTLARNFRVDLVPPQTSIASGPADGGWTNSENVTFDFTGSDDASATNELRYAWRVDGGTWSAFSTQTTAALTSLAEGPHTFEVYAVDKAGNADPTPAISHFTVDLTVPTVALGQGPAEGDTLPVSTVTLTWRGADDRTPVTSLKFSRSLDGGAYTAPATDTTVTLTSLADGSHTLAVRSHDLAGNASVPATRSWVVQATAPVIAILSGPGEGVHISVPDTSFTWTASSNNTPVGEIQYRHGLDAAPSGAWSRDTSVTLTGLAATSHTLNLEAQDRWGHVGTLARHFRVDLTPPQTTIASGPADGGWANSASATFGFTGTDDASATNELRYAWRVDSGVWSALSTQTSATAAGLAEGPHVFEVYAVDKAGNADPTPAISQFTVDLTLPETQLLSGPSATDTLTVAQATFVWTGSDDRTAVNQLTYAYYRLDGGGWSGYGSGTTVALTGFADGAHTFEVRSRDLAGNVDATPASRVFWSDAHGPVIAVVSGPAAGGCLDTSAVSFTWTASDVVTPVDLIEYRYRLDGGAWSAFGRDSSALFAALAEGSHTLSLEARDLKGNVGTLARTFVLDRTNPAMDLPTLRVLDGGVVRAQCTAGDNIGVTGFHVQIATDTLFASLVLDTDVGAAGTASVTGTAGHTYRARAYAVDCAGNRSAWSAMSNEATIDYLPDLTVLSVQAPATASSGQPILVSWTVADSGLGGTNAPQWWDDVYLTTTPTTDLSGATSLGRQGNLTALAAGESYLNKCAVTLPRGAAGTYYLVVVADHTNLVPEVNGSNNATVSGPMQVQFSDYADLVVPSATASPTAYSGDSITVAWTVKNQGQGRTDVDRWWDTVFLSADSLFDYMSPDSLTIKVLDQPLAQGQRVGALEAESSYVATAMVKLPDGIYGKYYVFVAADMNATSQGQYVSLAGDVFENTTELNVSLASVVEVTLQPPPNLAVDSLAVPDSVWSGAGMTVTWRVTNNGYNPTRNGSWTDRVCFSADTVLDGSDVVMGSFGHSGVLALGDSYVAQGTVTPPLTMSGAYYVFVKTDADGQVYESDTTDNARRSTGPLQVMLSPWPDLQVSGGTVPATGKSGASVLMTWSAVNAGEGTAAGRSWIDKVYVSRDSNGTGLRELASAPNPTGLEPGAEYTKQVSVYLPNDLAGTYYVYVVADANNSVFEHTDEGNNGLKISTITVQWPDLQVSGGNVVAVGQAGEPVPVSWSVRNAGLGTAAGRSWYDRVYVSTDPNGSGLRELASAPNSTGLAPGAEYVSRISMALPTDLSGTYYVYLVADANNGVYEYSDEGNNGARIGTLVVTGYPPADVAVTSVTSPDTAASGQALAASWSVRNQGTGATLATGWGENVYLSADTLIDGSDYRLATLTHGGALAPGASYNAQASGAIPNGMSGTYYVIVREEVSDANAANNVRVSAGPLHIGLTPTPDLALTALSCDAEEPAGQPLTVRYTLANQGTGVTVPGHWATAFYLSTDALLDASDLLLGSVGRSSALLSGDQASDSLVVSLPGWASGPFYLFAKVDSWNEVYEGAGESNNTARTQLYVYLPPPADLVVQDVTVPPTAIPGEPVTISWTLANVGTNAASGQVYSAVYVSADTSWDLTDPVLAIQSMSVDIPPGGMQRIAQRLSLEQAYQADALGNIMATLPGIPPGAYHAVVRTNVRNTLRELTTTNNVGASGDTMRVDVSPLVIGVPAAGTLTAGQSRYYRVETLAGQDLTVALTSEAADATNELYASYGTTPTAGSYDYTGPPEFTSHPSLLISGTDAGAYYVLVTARALPPGVTSETYTLEAHALPFSLTAVTPTHGGRAGGVTTTVRGAGLRDTTRLYLMSGSDTAAVARSIEWVSSTELKARWSLSWVNPGTYDLLAMTGDSVATLPGSFTVEEATALEVVTTAVKPDVIRRTGTTAFTFRYRNAGNRDVPVLKARLLYPAGSAVVNLATDTGLWRRSDLYPELFAPVSGDVYVMADTVCVYPLEVLDLVAVNVAPEAELSVTLNLRGFEWTPFSVRSLTEALETADYIRSELNGIEEARQVIVATPADWPAAVAALAASPGAFADTALAEGYVKRGLVTTADLADYRAANGGLTGGATSEPAGPAELLAELAGWDSTCAIPSALPECRPNEAPLATGLPASLSCVRDTVAVPYAVPQALTVGLIRASCGGYGRTLVADTRVVLPCDPNVMTGPAGFGADRWVGTGAPLVYHVDFENLSEVATAPAQVVKVQVPIDLGLDPATFRLGSMGFGTHVITVPANLTTYTVEPYYADLGLKVRVTAGIDIVQRAGVWTFTSIDPVTNAVPTNPLVGFLPVNDPYGLGQGYVNYTIRPLAGSANGTRLAAAAAITFDVNTAIATDTSLNRVDTGLPASHVLPAVEMLDTTLVRVWWVGADGDSGAGLKSVALYGRAYGAPYQLLASGLMGDSLTLALPWGYEYDFYSIATDNAGNVEGAKAVAEGVAVFGPLAVDTVRQAPLRYVLYPGMPNPFRGGAVLRFELPVATEASLEVFDVAGRRVATPLKPKRLPAGRHSVLFRPERLESGVYFCRLKAGRFEQTKKLVLIR